MSLINTQSRQAKVKEIQRRLGSYGGWLIAFFAITGGLGFFFPDGRALQMIFGSPPDIRFQILSPVNFNSIVLQGIIIKNKGGELAKDLTIDVNYNEAVITSQYYDSDVFLNLHDINVSDSKRTIEFKIEQLKPNTSGIFYMVISKKDDIPKVAVEHQFGSGREENYDIPKSFIWIMSIGGASTAILIFLLMRRAWRF